MSSKARRDIGILLLLLAFVMLPVLKLHAQTNLGQVNGTIYDQTGTVVPRAQIVLSDLDKSAQRQAISSGAGTYVIQSVPPGRYSLTVTMSGFSKYVVPEFRLQVNEARTIDAQLTIGVVTQTVEVKATPVALNQTDATLGEVVQHQEITQIPLNGRNFTQLMTLAPGVSPIAVGQQAAFMISGGWSYSVNGMRMMMNNFTLDGLENNMRFTNSYASPPPPDALEEFKISTHQSDAAAALAAGANINLVTRSGNNTFHGAAWDFLRNDKLTANGFFNNYYGSPKLAYKQNQFGFFVGGPVMLPHILNGKKSRTFFAAYYEGVRYTQVSDTYAEVPDAAERSGDFSELLGAALPGTDCLGRTVLKGALYDPSTYRVTAACPNGVTDPFPNDKLPSIHPIAMDYLNEFYPLPNRSTIPDLSLSQRYTQTSNQWGVRIDQNVGDKQMLFGRASRYNYYRLNPGGLPLDAFNQVNSGDNILGHYTRIISPTFLFDFLAGYNRASIPYRYQPLSAAWNKLVGDDFAIPLVSGFMPAGMYLNGSQFTGTTFLNYDLANPDTG